jgi:anti-sigma factor RsiW
MKPGELNLLHGHLNGTLSDADFGKLQALLRTSAEARRTLRALATVDAKLQALGSLSARTSQKRATSPLVPSSGRSRYQLPTWSPLAAAAAGLALALTGALFLHDRPTRSRPDVAAVISSAQNEIARLSISPPASFPAWASPTASLLEPPTIP